MTILKQTALAFALIISIAANATIRTVNNNITLPGSPGQYTTIQAAFSAAAAGDTILVSGSPLVYTIGTLDIDKRICILGAGYNPQNQSRLRTKTEGTIRFQTSAASGSTIMGLSLASNTVTFSISIINADTQLNNITIRRNWVTGIFLPSTTSNTLIAENIIKNAVNLNINYHINPYRPTHTGLKIFNNVFFGTDPVTNYGNNYSWQVKNNLFITGSAASPLSTSPYAYFQGNNSLAYDRCQNAIFENNIFYNCYPTHNQNGMYSPVNCSFVNNLTYSGATMPLIANISGNSASGNLDNTNPLFVQVFSNPWQIIDGFELFDIRLRSNSPAKNAGSDHTDIGPTGGAYPIYRNVSDNEQLSGVPPIPQVQSGSFVNGKNAVQTGGTLQINVKAKKRN